MIISIVTRAIIVYMTLGLILTPLSIGFAPYNRLSWRYLGALQCHTGLPEPLGSEELPPKYIILDSVACWIPGDICKAAEGKIWAGISREDIISVNPGVTKLASSDPVVNCVDQNNQPVIFTDDRLIFPMIVFIFGVCCFASSGLLSLILLHKNALRNAGLDMQDRLIVLAVKLFFVHLRYSAAVRLLTQTHFATHLHLHKNTCSRRCVPHHPFRAQFSLCICMLTCVSYGTLYAPHGALYAPHGALYAPHGTNVIMKIVEY